MARFAPTVCVFAAGLTVLAPAAMAGTSRIGTVAPVPALSQGIASVHLPAAAPSFAASPYAGAASAFAGSGAGVGSLSGGVGGGMNVTQSDGISVQTSIDASNNVQASHNVSINETVNGQPVGSSYASAGFLDVMTQAQADAEDVLAQRQAANQQLEDEAAMIVQVWQAQGQGY